MYHTQHLHSLKAFEAWLLPQSTLCLRQNTSALCLAQWIVLANCSPRTFWLGRPWKISWNASFKAWFMCVLDAKAATNRPVADVKVDVYATVLLPQSTPWFFSTWHSCLLIIYLCKAGIAYAIVSAQATIPIWQEIQLFECKLWHLNVNCAYFKDAFTPMLCKLGRCWHSNPCLHICPQVVIRTWFGSTSLPCHAIGACTNSAWRRIMIMWKTTQPWGMLPSQLPCKIPIHLESFFIAIVLACFVKVC